MKIRSFIFYSQSEEASLGPSIHRSSLLSRLRESYQNCINKVERALFSCTDLFTKWTALATSLRALEALPLAKLRLVISPRAGEARRQAALGGLPGAAEGCGMRGEERR